MWITLPCPDEAKLTSPGLALASAIRSLTVFAGTDGLTTISSGPCDSWTIGVMSVDRVEVELVDARVDRVAGGDQHQRVAVGRRLDALLDADARRRRRACSRR